MKTELKEKIRNLKYDEKIEFDYNGIDVVVQNFKNDLIIKPKLNIIAKAISLLILMFIFSFIIVIIGNLFYESNVKVTAGGLTIFAILFLYKPFATKILKLFYSKKLKELNNDLSDVKYLQEVVNENQHTNSEPNLYDYLMFVLIGLFAFCSIYAIIDLFNK